MPLEILTVPCLSDNYAYLLRDAATGEVGLVDAPEAAPIEAALKERGWGLDLILITHHHADHIDGVEALRAVHDARVAGAAADRHRLPALDVALEEGDTIALGRERGAGLRGARSHGRTHRLLFRRGEGRLHRRQPDGDGLRAARSKGRRSRCGRRSRTLAALPDETLVYSGHEYAESNVRFALSVDAENPALRERAAEIAAMRQMGGATVPARLELERATNPFLRCSDAGFKARLGLGEFAGCPSFRRGAPAQGRFLSRAAEGRAGRWRHHCNFFALSIEAAA